MSPRIESAFISKKKHCCRLNDYDAEAVARGDYSYFNHADRLFELQRNNNSTRSQHSWSFTSLLKGAVLYVNHRTPVGYGETLHDVADLRAVSLNSADNVLCKLVRLDTSVDRSIIKNEKRDLFSRCDVFLSARRGDFLVEKSLYSLPSACREPRKLAVPEQVRAGWRREVNILRSLNSTFILNLRDHLETSVTLYKVFELPLGGSLASKIFTGSSLARISKLEEFTAKLYFYQLARALTVVHSMGFVHRDVSLDNMHIMEAQKLAQVKLSGFKHAVDYTKTTVRGSPGTPAYRAPEVVAVSGEVLEPTTMDVWSLGVCLYAALKGYLPTESHAMPLDENEAEELVEEWMFDAGDVGANARDLLRAMLTVDPDERISLDEVLRHAWMQDPKMKQRYNCFQLMNSRSNSLRRKSRSGSRSMLSGRSYDSLH